MLFLVWYDPNTAHSVSEKILAAVAAYTKRFAIAPNLVLVSGGETAELEGIAVRSARTVQPNHYWAGRSDDPNATSLFEHDGATVKPDEPGAD